MPIEGRKMLIWSDQLNVRTLWSFKCVFDGDLLDTQTTASIYASIYVCLLFKWFPCDPKMATCCLYLRSLSLLHCMMSLFGPFSILLFQASLHAFFGSSVQLFICLWLKVGICLPPLHSACQGVVVSTGQLASDRQNTIILSEEAASTPKAFGQSRCPASLFVCNTECLWFCVSRKV